MSDERIVQFPGERGELHEASTAVEHDLVERMGAMKREILDGPTKTIEWWSEAHSDGVRLLMKATMPDGTFFEATVAPMMVSELLTEGMADDFFEHVKRELTLRVKEWSQGMHTPRPPDTAEHILGFRQWRVDWENKTLGPIGVQGAHWTGAIWQTAECRAPGRYRDAPYGHDAPHPKCHCGLYALHEMPEATPYDYNQGRPSMVWGVIQAKGKMEVHSNGIRAQYARPVMLCLPEPTQWYKHDSSTGEGTVVDEYEDGALPIQGTAAREITALAKHLGLDAVSWSYVRTKASEYGNPVPMEFRP